MRLVSFLSGHITATANLLCSRLNLMVGSHPVKAAFTDQSAVLGEQKMSRPLSEDPVEMGAQTVGRTDGNVNLSWLYENKMTKISSCLVFSGIQR